MTFAPVEVLADPALALRDYAAIPCAFRADHLLEVIHGPAGLTLRPATCAPFAKDYDAEPGNHPSEWGRRFDVSRWGVLGAGSPSAPAGGAVVAWETPDVGWEPGVAVLWDLRVAPPHRRTGVGRALFHAAAKWAAARGATRLEAETQNINLPANRLYASLGCALRSIDRFGYPDLPGEARLVWSLDLTTRGARPG